MKTSLKLSIGALAVAGAFASTAAHAAGFMLTEQTAGAMGRAYAGVGVDGLDIAGMYYNPATDYFTVGGIALPAGVTDYTLSFGALFPSDDMTLALSSDGVTWKPLSYTAAATYNTWTLATVGFTLTEPVGSLYIRFTPTGTERQYGLNFDDLRLVTRKAPGFRREVSRSALLVGNPGPSPTRSETHAAYFLTLPWLATALILASMVAGSPM